MATSKDINWINCSKAISMIAVFFVHCQIYYGYVFDTLNEYIYPFYVNAFFFVSGYLLFRKQLSAPTIGESYKEFLTGGGKTLLFNILNRVAVPSILFAAIEYIPKSILGGEGISVEKFLWETVGGGTYWFTSALVIAQLILLLILVSRYRNIWLYWIVSLAIFASGMYLARHDMNFLCLPRDLWLFKHGLYAIAFLTAGGLYWKYETMINKLMQKWIVVTMVVIYFVLFYFWSEHIRVLVSLLDVNWSGYFAGCFASVLLIELCKYLPRIRILTYIGQKSIAFYFMSGALPIVISMIINKFGFDHTWYGLIIVWIVSISFAYLITHILNRYVPWVFDLRGIVDKKKELFNIDS